MTRFARTLIATFATLGLVAGSAAAQVKKDEPAKAPTPTAVTPTAAPAVPAAPTPPPELLAAAKAMKGTWKCKGTMNNPDGTSKPGVVTITNKVDLDKFWIVTTLTEKKSKTSPVPFKFVSYRTFDPAAKKWTSVFFDNMGGHQVSSSISDGSGGTLNFEGTWAMGGMSTKTKDTEQVISPKEVKMSGQMSMDAGKTWAPAYDVTCKK